MKQAATADEPPLSTGPFSSLVLSSMHDSASPEEELLRLCARTCTGEAIERRIETLLHGPVDWERLLNLTGRHGTILLLHRHLHPHFEALVPSEPAAHIQKIARSYKMRNLAQTQELLRVVAYLEDAGVPVMPFKGPALGALAYGDPTLRTFVDLDVLVHRHDMERANALLAEQGYEAYRSLSAQEKQAHIETQMGYEMVHYEKRSTVEVHWNFLNKVHAFDLRPDAVWARSTTQPLGGRTIRRFSTEDLLLYLCAHGSKSFWKRLLWVCDVAELVRASPQLDWNVLLSEASRLRSRRMVLLGLGLAHDVLGTPLPGSVLSEIEHNENVLQMIAQVRRSLFEPPAAHSEDGIEKAVFHLQMRDRLRDRLPYYRHLLWLAVLPNDKDRTLLDLPPALSFLHYAVRPLRLFFEAGYTAASALQRFISR